MCDRIWTPPGHRRGTGLTRAIDQIGSSDSTPSFISFTRSLVCFGSSVQILSEMIIKWESIFMQCRILFSTFGSLQIPTEAPKVAPGLHFKPNREITTSPLLINPNHFHYYYFTRETALYMSIILVAL